MFLLIDKPKGITSHDVVDQIRKITGIKKVGHGGTLDPNATGLLIIGIERSATKKLGEIAQNTVKEYEAEIIFGEERDTDDIEGNVISTSEEKPSTEEVNEVVKKFIGKQKQVPPIFSAIKKDGKKAYEQARKGKEVVMEPREINVYSAKVISYKYPVLNISFEVSSGTYIRALARDIGKELKTYGYLANLRRTRIGEFKIDNAVQLNELETSNWKEYSIESEA